MTELKNVGAVAEKSNDADSKTPWLRLQAATYQNIRLMMVMWWHNASHPKTSPEDLISLIAREIRWTEGSQSRQDIRLTWEGIDR